MAITSQLRRVEIYLKGILTSKILMIVCRGRRKPLIIIGGTVLMKEFLEQKAIQLKSWIEKGTMVDNKFSLAKTFLTGSALYSLWCFAKFILTLCLKFLTVFLVAVDKALPYAIHFLEAFISTLSYQNKKEFFYGLFSKQTIWNFQ
ncbi:hypothetical protein PDM89_11920 [Bacillus cereus]|nr:hypothetical protein [Bacillus cereus]